MLSSFFYHALERFQAQQASNPRPAVLETAALPTELYAYFKPLFYLGLFVDCMLPLKGTILPEFKLLLNIPAVFAGGIIAPLAFAALQGY